MGRLLAKISAFLSGDTGTKSRRWLTTLLLGLSVVGLASWMSRFYPVTDWLVWRYAGYSALAGLFSLSSWAGGLALLRWIDRDPLRNDERLALGFGLGVLLFFMLTFLAGLLHVLGSIYSIALPIGLLALGRREIACVVHGTRRRFQLVGFRLIRPATPIQVATAVLMFVGLALVYMTVATPLNVGADSHWYHLAVSEHYAAAGAIEAFREGWYLGAYPQLASVLYTWAFCLPGLGVGDQVMLAAHLEFALFVATLASIPVLARRLSGSGRFGGTGAVLFLFPGLFVYDSGLIVGADHVLAFFTPALAIALLRVWRGPSLGASVVVGLLGAAMVLTKPQGIYFVPVVALWALAATIRHRKIGVLLTIGLVALVASSPHWLKNWVWYGDPAYPHLHAHLNSDLYDGATDLFPHTLLMDYFRPHGTVAEQWKGLLETSATFAFVPHNWAPFHGNRPVFGFLFTLLLPVLFLQKRNGRALALALSAQIGVAVWFFTFQQDRYLQALVPWMAAVVVVALYRAWDNGIFARLFVVLLTGLQLLWASDLPFLKTHAMVQDSMWRGFGNFVATAPLGGPQRLHLWGRLQEVGPHLPDDARVLLHGVQERLGLGAVVVGDRPGWQGRVNYARTKTPRAAAELLKSLETTHVVWTDHPNQLVLPDTLANEVAFADLVERYAGPSELVAHFRIAPWKLIDPKTASADPLRIGVINCKTLGTPEVNGPNDFASGIYTPDELARGSAPSAPLPAKANELDALIRKSSCGLPPRYGSALASAGSRLKTAELKLFSNTFGYQVYIRQRRHEPGSPVSSSGQASTSPRVP